MSRIREVESGVEIIRGWRKCGVGEARLTFGYYVTVRQE
jgi:hypothetical protein